MKKIFTAAMALIVSISYLAMAGPLAAAPGELVENGSFEAPIVDAPENWDIFVTSEVPGWTVEWMPIAVSGGATDPANLELHRGVNGWLPQEGEQYAELDTDWDGPGGCLNGEPASVKIYQDLATCACHDYELSFWFSPRPGTDAANNVLEVWWDGTLVDTISRAGSCNTDWSEHTYTLHASSDITRLEFRDVGTADSLGTFLDDVSVIGEMDCPEECCDAPTIVINENCAFVGNHVEANANTGGNTADGSTGGDGGDGGDINNSDGDVRRSTTGSGGAGGNGGDGGMIVTGSATAEAGVINVVNTSRTTIDHCACDGYVCDCGPDIVVNRSRAIVLNHVEAEADTGDNEANGGEGDEGGEGGDINNGDGCDPDVENSHTGDGGTGGHGGTGGTVITYDANASAGAINVVNRNVTRIRR